MQLENLFPPVIDNTIREDWLRCPHFFFRKHIQGLRQAQLGEGMEIEIPPSIHLHFGGCLARGLEVARRAYVEDGVDEHAAVLEGASALITAWGDDSLLPAPTTRTEENKTLANALLCLDRYFAEWPLDDPSQAIGSREGKALVEFSGAVPVPGLFHPVSGEPLLYAGRFDAIVDRHGALWGLDDKTTGSNVDSEGWRDQWRINGQFTGYTWIAREWGFDLTGFLVHGVQVLKGSTKFAEVIAPRAKWQVEQWLRQLRADVTQMLYQFNTLTFSDHGPMTGSPAFPQLLGSGCVHFHRPCAFLDHICSQPNPEAWIEGNFLIERWNPLRRSVDE